MLLLVKLKPKKMSVYINSSLNFPPHQVWQQGRPHPGHQTLPISELLGLYWPGTPYPGPGEKGGSWPMRPLTTGAVPSPVPEAAGTCMQW